MLFNTGPAALLPRSNKENMTAEVPQLMLFNKWSFQDVTVSDISLLDYLALKQKPKYQQSLPHTAGRYNVKRFRKAQCPIVERLVNSLMQHGRNNGKKLMAVRYSFSSFLNIQSPLFTTLLANSQSLFWINLLGFNVIRIIKHSFEIIHLMTDKNPIQILVDAIINSCPREDSTRVGTAGVVKRQAVDVSPLRRVNQSLYLLTTGVLF